MKMLVLGAFVIGAFVPVPGQEKVLQQTEFEAAVKDDREQGKLWTDKTYRMTVSTSATMSDRPEFDYSAKMIFEWGANGSFRSVNTSTFGGKSKTTETLRVGGSVYSRVGTEAWKRAEQPVSSLEEKSGNPQPESLQVLSSEVEYRSLGPAEWKGEKVHMYQRTERKKTVGGATGNVTDRVNVTKYWVNADGLIYRSEFRAESRSNARTSVTAVVTEREAVPGLTFSEPLVDAHP